MKELLALTNVKIYNVLIRGNALKHQFLIVNYAQLNLKLYHVLNVFLDFIELQIINPVFQIVKLDIVKIMNLMYALQQFLQIVNFVWMKGINVKSAWKDTIFLQISWLVNKNIKEIFAMILS